MRTPGIAIGDKNFGSPNLFERFNMISSLMYEGTRGIGKLILANPDSGAVDLLVRFAEPIPFREHRWSTEGIADGVRLRRHLSLIARRSSAWEASLQTLTHAAVKTYSILSSWITTFGALGAGSRILLVSNYGTPSLPQQRFPRDRLLDTFQRLFPESREQDVDRFTMLFDAAVCQRHGSMLIVASDAEPEAHRLQGQGTKIEPTTLTPELYQQVSSVDGAVLVDPRGICYAIGVILDGPASSDCTPSRGARYNSGIRYIGSLKQAPVSASSFRMIRRWM